jgi:ABC-2 type transport system permease protein
MIKTFIEELKLIFADGGAMLILLFAMLIYTTIYSIAYGAEVVTDVAIAVVDEDNTPKSRELINGLRSGPGTALGYEPQSLDEAKALFYSRKVYGIVIIPDNYERDLLSQSGATVSIILDGSHLLLYREVLEQAMSDSLAEGGEVEVEYLISKSEDDNVIMGIVEPVEFSKHVLYNSSYGYGSFVMPSIVVVIIQQTLLIGVAMVAMRRRKEPMLGWVDCTRRVLVRALVYVVIYGISLLVIMLTIWQYFGFPYNGNLLSIALFMLLYIVASSSLAQAVSHLFKRREAPIMLLMWSSVPILLLAGVSYPREAFPVWLYDIGRLFPSSSAVGGFIRLNSMGASLLDVKTELTTLLILAFVYTILAIILEKHASFNKKYNAQ